MSEPTRLFIRKGQKKFYIISQYGELLDLALYLQDIEKHEVIFNIPDHDYKKIGEGMVKKDSDWFQQLGNGYVWIIDGCDKGKMQDWLRKKGEYVFGGCEEGDELENDRQKNQNWFKELGFEIVPSRNFNDFDEGMQFIQDNPDTMYIMKQNGDAPKRLNHKGKFKGGIDMLYHLEQMKKSWNESEYGEVNFDLMEVVEGTELAASAFFNGTDWMRNKDGKVVAFLNFEHKKEIDGDLGETTGELGTLFYGTTEDNKLVQDILMKKGIKKYLAKIGFHGVFDINCMLTDKGIIPLEPTCRPGIPSTSYEFLESIENCGEMIESVAKGENKPIAIKEGWGMVMVVASKPFPVESDIPQEATSIGEKLWILDGDNPIKDFTQEQKKHIHLENFEKKDGDYLVATKNGYLLTVSAFGNDIEKTREDLIEYIKNNVYISGMKYRTDIGEKYEGEEDMIKKNGEKPSLFVKK